MQNNIDLPQLLKHLNYSSSVLQSALDNYERLPLGSEIEIVDDSPKIINEDHSLISGFIDGIQGIKILGFRDLRPYALSYASAGCTDDVANLLIFAENISLKCTELDREWAESLPGNIPVRAVDSQDVWNIGPKLVEDLASDRVKLEHSVAAKALTSINGGLLIVDGSLVGHPYDERMVGVVKTMHQQYLPDESFLESLKENYRSLIFKIPAGFKGSTRDRYSCYLKMFPLTNSHVSYGLVRVEVFSLEMMDAACSSILADRQSIMSADKRYDRHLSGVSVCENVLKSKKPAFFNM